jgi:hypothetical protein
MAPVGIASGGSARVVDLGSAFGFSAAGASWLVEWLSERFDSETPVGLTEGMELFDE